jgi:hypothetical protein
LVGHAVVLREVNVQERVPQPVKVLAPTVVAPLQFGVPAVQREWQERHPVQDGLNDFEVIGVAERDVLQDDGDIEPGGLLAEWPQDLGVPGDGLLGGEG